MMNLDRPRAREKVTLNMKIAGKAIMMSQACSLCAYRLPKGLTPTRTQRHKARLSKASKR